MLLLLLLILMLRLEHHLLREAAASVLAVNLCVCLRDVAVDLVLIWMGQSRTYGSNHTWVCAQAPVWVWVRVRVQGGAGLELKSGQVLAKAVRSVFGNVLC
jgi:hypothetical protein